MITNYVSMKFQIPDDFDVNTKCECDECGVELEIWECNPIVNPHRNLMIGDIVPAGGCPHCVSGWAYVLED